MSNTATDMRFDESQWITKTVNGETLTGIFDDTDELMEGVRTVNGTTYKGIFEHLDLIKGIKIDSDGKIYQGVWIYDKSHIVTNFVGTTIENNITYHMTYTLEGPLIQIKRTYSDLTEEKFHRDTIIFDGYVDGQHTKRCVKRKTKGIVYRDGEGGPTQSTTIFEYTDGKVVSESHSETNLHNHCETDNYKQTYVYTDDANYIIIRKGKSTILGNLFRGETLFEYINNTITKQTQIGILITFFDHHVLDGTIITEYTDGIKTNETFSGEKRIPIVDHRGMYTLDYRTLQYKEGQIDKNIKPTSEAVNNNTKIKTKSKWFCW